MRELNTSLVTGGYPETVDKPLDQAKEILKDYRNTYLQRDILELANIQDLNAFRALCNALAQAICTPVNLKNLADECGVSPITCKKYIHALEQTCIIFQLPAYIYGPAKRYLKATKWYFSDNGLLDALGVRLSEGQVFENFVIAEIRKRLIVANLDESSMFFYKSKGGAEIDCIVEIDADVHLFEVKNSKNPDRRHVRNLRNFTAKNRTVKQATVVYRGEHSGYNSGIRHLSAYDLFGNI